MIIGGKTSHRRLTFDALSIGGTIGGPKKIQRTYSRLLSIKLHADVVESARIVAAYRGQTMADVIGDLVRPLLKKLERDEHAKRNRKADTE